MLAENITFLVILSATLVFFILYCYFEFTRINKHKENQAAFWLNVCLFVIVWMSFLICWIFKLNLCKSTVRAKDKEMGVLKTTKDAQIQILKNKLTRASRFITDS
jgi:hypothetical protein